MLPGGSSAILEEQAGQSKGLGLSGPTLWFCSVPLWVRGLSFQGDIAPTQVWGSEFSPFLLEDSFRSVGVGSSGVWKNTDMDSFSEQTDTTFTSFSPLGHDILGSSVWA